MIRIEKPTEPPSRLQGVGAEKARRDRESYDRHVSDYRLGKRKFDFKDGIYGHNSVRNSLSQAQHEKCCYCESRLGGTSPECVEHFRPKGRVSSVSGQGVKYPGYYWLAYSWNNLFLSCVECNSSKRDLFPLQHQTTRAESHHDNIEMEQPLFVDPGQDDPRLHIQFYGSAVAPLSDRGLSTIESMKLQRSNLEELRGDKLNLIKKSRLIIELASKLEPGELDPGEIEEARRFLGRSITPEETYSAMARDFISQNGGFDYSFDNDSARGN